MPPVDCERRAYDLAALRRRRGVAGCGGGARRNGGGEADDDALDYAFSGVAGDGASTLSAGDIVSTGLADDVARAPRRGSAITGGATN